jgi:dihydrofolate synthase / folylpolyglutamate synthase
VNYDEALAYLDDHATYEKTGRVTDPTLDKMVRLMGFMGDPQVSYPVIHITGTNGKGSVAQMVTRLLMAQGLTVGTTTSPHLERVNERIRRNGETITDNDFAEQIAAIADLEGLAGVRPGYFEATTAAAFRWFADVAVDVAVVEVGMLGAWDATNVVDADVAVVTNVGMDHAQFAGPTTLHIAREKSGIVKPNSRVVIGETDPELVQVFRDRPNAGVIERDIDFECIGNQLALGGRVVDLRTPSDMYGEIFVPLHGRHQGDNAAVALAAVESFFDAPLSYEVVAEGFAAVEWPGRFEVLGHQPLVIVDGAHNPHGADACANVYREDFDPAGKRILVVGFLTSQDPAEMLSALHADETDIVIACTPPSPRGRPAKETADAARALGCANVMMTDTVSKACDRALANADSDDAILVTGSLYVVGEARPHLQRVLARR